VVKTEGGWLGTPQEEKENENRCGTSQPRHRNRGENEIALVARREGGKPSIGRHHYQLQKEKKDQLGQKKKHKELRPFQVQKPTERTTTRKKAPEVDWDEEKEKKRTKRT